MTKIRLYINQKLDKNQDLYLSQEQSHYLINVMRLHQGAEITVFNSNDGEWLAEIICIKKKISVIKILKILRKNLENQYHKKITLVFSLLKNTTPSFILQKVTELGVIDLYPAVFQHSVIRKSNVMKLEKVAIEAAEQCNRLDIPRIHDIQKFTDWLKKFKSMIMFYNFSLENQNQKITIIIAVTKQDLEFLNKKNSKVRYIYYDILENLYNIILIVGPEGGFHYKELEDLLDLVNCYEDKIELRILHFDHYILRAETAIISALSVLLYKNQKNK